MKLIYPAFSKHLFYFRTHISKYVLENKGVPLNPLAKRLNNPTRYFEVIDSRDIKEILENKAKIEEKY